MSSCQTKLPATRQNCAVGKFIRNASSGGSPTVSGRRYRFQLRHLVDRTEKTEVARPLDRDVGRSPSALAPPAAEAAVVPRSETRRERNPRRYAVARRDVRTERLVQKRRAVGVLVVDRWSVGDASDELLSRRWNAPEKEADVSVRTLPERILDLTLDDVGRSTFDGGSDGGAEKRRGANATNAAPTVRDRVEASRA